MSRATAKKDSALTISTDNAASTGTLPLHSAQHFLSSLSNWNEDDLADLHNLWKILCRIRNFLSLANNELNEKNISGETPVIECFKVLRLAVILLSRAPVCNDTTVTSKIELASLVILQHIIHIAHTLIESGANLDEQDDHNRTALFYAIESNNLEAVCMLLCYGADIDVACAWYSPFMFTMQTNEEEEMNYSIRRAFLNYYDELPCHSLEEPSVAMEFIKAGANVNCFNFYRGELRNSAEVALWFNAADVFKEIWSRLDHCILMNCVKPFLLALIEDCEYPSVEWLECLYLVLESPAAYKLVEHCDHYLTEELHGTSFFCKLLRKFSYRGIESADRVAIIYIFLSLGCRVDIQDISFAHQMYRFGAEMEALLYAVSPDQRIVPEKLIWPVPTFICALKQDFGPTKVYNMCRRMISHIQIGGDVGYVIDTLKFFSLPYHLKLELINFYRKDSDRYDPQLLQKLEKMPELPSLMELSRNRAHKFIHKNFQVNKYFYQLLDVVKRLNLPESMKDIISFKVPVYQ